MRLRNANEGQVNLQTNEIGMVAMATAKAEKLLARGQNNPNKKITTTPGEIIPVNSWIYWKACFKPTRLGAIQAANKRENAETNLPTRTNSLSEVFALSLR